MSTETRPLAKVLFFAPRDDSRRPFGGDSRVLRFQTKFAYRWSKFKRECLEEHRRQALRATASMRDEMTSTDG